MEEIRQLKHQTEKVHKLVLNQRSSGCISGVKHVVSFDPKEILLETEQGALKISGDQLHISRLTLEKGEVDVQGKVDSLIYSEGKHPGNGGEGLFARLFR